MTQLSTAVNPQTRGAPSLITPDSLVNLSRRKAFRIGEYNIISQDPNAIPDQFRRAAVVEYLPLFLLAWGAIEKVTGHAWKNTSYIRDSPSHKRAHAFDLAPDISQSALSSYAVTNNSDPVLYKRRKLITDLQRLRNLEIDSTGKVTLGIFIEPDHLHLQVLQRDVKGPPIRIIKWKVLKPIYSDTNERASLPDYI